VSRQRGGTTRPRDDHEDDSTSSPEEIGLLLRQAREERGLDLVTVHDRLNRPITQLEALERGDLAALPDQVLALATLRRYATFLGLDGDPLALQMIDAFSAVSADTAAVGAVGAATTTVVAAVPAGPEHLRAFTQTGEVPSVGGSATGRNQVSGPTGHPVDTGAPTGTFPVVPRQDLKHSKRSVARARRRLRAPTSLKVLTWTAATLVLVVVVGFGILHVRPQWLAQAHILHVAEPGGTTTTPSASHTPTTTPTVVQSSTGGQGSAYLVSAKSFTVAIATTGRCWVQVTSSASSTPLVSGVQTAGKLLTFASDGTMTVQVGSSAVLVGVTVDKKNVFLNAPKAVPYTYTFAPAS
jgi:cytoskeleton protein RodZ